MIIRHYNNWVAESHEKLFRSAQRTHTGRGGPGEGVVALQPQGERSRDGTEAFCGLPGVSNCVDRFSGVLVQEGSTWFDL